jgi:hypothetical protein
VGGHRQTKNGLFSCKRRGEQVPALQRRCSTASGLSASGPLSPFVYVHRDTREKLRRHVQCSWRTPHPRRPDIKNHTLPVTILLLFQSWPLRLKSIRPPSTLHCPYFPPKPFVHLIGPPLGLALDSHIAGNSTHSVRSGSRPNAVFRPFPCPQPNQRPETLSFAVFALRDLKANQEVINGMTVMLLTISRPSPKALILSRTLLPLPHSRPLIYYKKRLAVSFLPTLLARRSCIIFGTEYRTSFTA